MNHQYTYLPQLDGGIYLIKNGEVVERAGADAADQERSRITTNAGRGRSFLTSASMASRNRSISRRLANDGTKSKHLPEGTPFGLVGTSSFYKRESYPNGVCRRAR